MSIVSCPVRSHQAPRTWRHIATLMGSTALVAVALVMPASAATKTWTGAISNDWFTAGNWLGGIPGTGDDVVIDPATSDLLEVNNTTAAVGMMTVGGANSFGELALENGALLTTTTTVLGRDASSGGRLNIYTGAWWNNTGAVTIGDSGASVLSITGGSLATVGDTVVADKTGSSGFITMVDAGTTMTATSLVFGKGGNGQLNVASGSALTTDSASFGVNAGSMGSALITNAGSRFTATTLVLGNMGNSSVSVRNGALMESQDSVLAAAAGSHSEVFIQDAGSKWDMTGHDLTIAAAGSGEVDLLTSATLLTQNVTVGAAAGSDGLLSIGSDSTFTNANQLIIGASGTGSVSIQFNGTASTGMMVLGENSTGDGSLFIGGGGPMTAGVIYVGSSGTGHLGVGSGSVLTSGPVFVGDLATGQGDVTVQGGGKWDMGASLLTIANIGNGEVQVQDHGTLLTTDVDLGVVAGASGKLNVLGTNALWTDSGQTRIGVDGDGSLIVQQGGVGSTGLTTVAQNAGSSGAIKVMNAGSQLTTGLLELGLDAVGTLSITDGGVLTGTQEALLGDTSTGQGTVTLSDHGSTWDLDSQALTVGVSGKGALSIFNAATALADSATVAHNAGSTGAITTSGTGSFLRIEHKLILGDGGAGTMTVSNGAQAQNLDAVLGAQNGSSGSVSLSGGSVWTSAGTLVVGDAGSGSVTASDVSSGVTAHNATILANAAGATGDVVIKNQAQWDNQADLTVGGAGTATLTLSNAGPAQSRANVDVGRDASGQGTVNVTGTGSLWTIDGSLTLGDNGFGTLLIDSKGAVAAQSSVLGNTADATGTITVDGLGSQLNLTGNLEIGEAGTGDVTVRNGGVLTMSTSLVGMLAGSSGTMTVDGAGSKLVTDVGFYIGENGSGSALIKDGADVTAGSVALGRFMGSRGDITVTGVGSTVTDHSDFIVGSVNAGTLTVAAGGEVTTDAFGELGYFTGSNGSAAVTDSGSAWNIGGKLEIGRGGTGSLLVAEGGTVSAAGGVVIGLDAGSTGKLVIGGDTNAAATAAGILNTPTVTFGAGGGLLAFHHTGTNYNFDAAISGNGTIYQFSGVTHLTADSSGYSGPTDVTGGTLLVDGKLGGTVSVTGTGRLGGKGVIGGDVTVDNGGSLVGVQGQTLAMDSLTLGVASVDVTLSDPGGAALFDVAHDLTLDGDLNIESAGTFGPGVYRLFDYGGTLTDNGLNIDATPDGTTAADFSIQTAVAGQVNLLDTAAAQLRFWDGDAAGNANNNAVDGGGGTWSATANNFTDGDGVSNGPQAPQPGFAVFEGTGGVVTVNDNAGPVTVTGMQFASDGYVIGGNPIALSGGTDILRVGDGTAAGAAYVARIDANLTGAAGINKTDLGELLLTGVNSYTGLTTISDGLLALANADSIAASSGLVDDGAFNIAATTSGAQIKTLSGAGTVQLGTRTLTLTQANDTFAGVVGGAGGLALTGGSEALSGINTYTGATNVASGATLGLTGGGSIADSSGVADNGVFDISGAGAGVSIKSVSGTGLVHLGANVLTLTAAGTGPFSGVIDGSGGLDIVGGIAGFSGANTYTGGTHIGALAGLVLGNTGTSGSIVGDVVDDGILGFGRTDAYTFAGDISGAGQVALLAPGTITLSGINTYAGGTTIVGGTMIGSATGFGSGAILDNGALIIDQATGADFANAISGTGAFEKRGAGSLNLTGTSTFTGATTVADGRLAVNGALADSIVTILDGATLGGNGTVGGVTAQSGATVGPGNSIGTLTVNGDYAQADGSTYQVELTTTGQNDRINVSGTATIGSGAILNVVKTDAGPYVLGTHYTVLTATGGVDGTYDLTGDLSAFYSLEANYDANDVYLDVIQKHSFASIGKTPNQIATGTGLDSLPFSGALPVAVGNLATSTQALAAFDDLSGELHASIRSGMLDDSRFVREGAIDRLRTPIDNGDGPALWSRAYGAWNQINGGGNAAALQHDTGGLLIGADGLLADGWRVGVVGGFGHSSFTVGNGRQSSGTSNDYDIGLYGGTQWGDVAFRSGLAYTWHDLSTTRAADFAGFFDLLQGSHGAGTAQAFGELAYDLQAGPVALEPFANLAYVNLSTDGFTEKGGAAALSDQAGSSGTTFTTLGLRASTNFVLDNGTNVTANGSIGWRHAFGDISPASAMAFAGGSTFAIGGVSIAGDSVVVDAGIDLNLTANTTLGLSYDGQFGSGTTAQTLRGNFAIKF
ncbi:MAG TPA: autotransporter domain-containing protein [Devosiaceae bacterium]|jgi:outer membrane autotransporter protein